MAALQAQTSSSKIFSFNRLDREAGNEKPRLGRLCLQGRTPMETPHYVAVGSRGAVPHLSQDMMRYNTSISAMYTALEDCEYSLTLPLEWYM